MSQSLSEWIAGQPADLMVRVNHAVLGVVHALGLDGPEAGFVLSVVVCPDDVIKIDIAVGPEVVSDA